MGAGHGHGHGHRNHHRRPLLIVFALTTSFMAVEAAAGFLTGSLALLADAGHMLTDSAALGLALFAAWMAGKPASPRRTYGYLRLEVLAAAVNASALIVISGFLVVEAVSRLGDPPPVEAGPMMAVAAAGLVVNLIGIAVLHGKAEKDLNVRAAFLEVIADALGSVAALAAGGIMLAGGGYLADPLAGLLVSAAIFPRTWKLLAQAVNILLEAAPPHLDVPRMEEALRRLPGVCGVHDLHVWTISSGREAMSVHLVLEDGAEPQASQRTLEAAGKVLREEFRVDHTTIQIEHTDLRADEAGY